MGTQLHSLRSVFEHVTANSVKTSSSTVNKRGRCDGALPPYCKNILVLNLPHGCSLSEWSCWKCEFFCILWLPPRVQRYTHEVNW